MENPTYGAIVGRFQVDELHDGHRHLIDSVRKNHRSVIIFLGLSPARVTRNNPLDFMARKQMIQEVYPDINVLYIKDVCSDDVWSRTIDRQISDIIGKMNNAILYGSRESFIDHYTGRYPTHELKQEVFISGTQIREDICATTKASADFRKGVIWGTVHQYPHIIPTVDVAIWNEERDQLLMARKPNETKHRFVGGFVDSKDPFEEHARREVLEETTLEIDDLRYVATVPIDDWRYRREIDGIVTTFFEALRIFGTPTPLDDICELKWFRYDKLREEDLVDEHKPLLRELWAKTTYGERK